jgi:MFS family permease
LLDIGIFSETFGVDPNTAAGLINYPNLAFGFGSLILVPAYHKFGRRPIMLLSIIFYMAGLVGASQAKTYSGLMAARVIHGFGSGVCEALPVQLVNDIFFLHERGKKIGWYTCALCMGATGPLYAGYMLAGGYSYNLFFWVEFAFAAGLFVLAFIFVEESRYKRVLAPPAPPTPSDFEPDSSKWNDKMDTDEYNRPGFVARGVAAETEIGMVLPPRKSLAQQLKPWSSVDHSSKFFLTGIRSFTYLLVPSVFWVITTYGLYIGLCGLSFNFVFPIKIVAPPYNWSQTDSGLIAVATIIGYVLALPLLPLVDRWAAYLTKRNGGIREAEMRLGLLLVPMVVAPAGLVIFGMTAEKNLHWMGYFVAVASTQWAAYFYFTVTLAYAVDSVRGAPHSIFCANANLLSSTRPISPRCSSL